MQENQNFSNKLIIRFLCLIAFLFAILDFFELQKIYENWLYYVKIYQENVVILDKCIKFPFLLKSIFTLFSLFTSISAMIITFLVSINLNFFIEKFFLSFLYYNFYLFGPYMLFFSFYGIMNRDKIFLRCKNEENSFNFFSNDFKKYNFFENNFKNMNNNFSSENLAINWMVGSDRLNYDNNYISISNIFNLVTTVTIAFLICLSMSLYETYDVYCRSILNLDNGNKVLRKIFWWVVDKNRTYLRNLHNNMNNFNNIVNGNLNYTSIGNQNLNIPEMINEINNNYRNFYYNNNSNYNLNTNLTITEENNTE